MKIDAHRPGGESPGHTSLRLRAHSRVESSPELKTFLHCPNKAKSPFNLGLRPSKGSMTQASPDIKKIVLTSN